jgi:hypothetical protein
MRAILYVAAGAFLFAAAVSVATLITFIDLWSVLP